MLHSYGARLVASAGWGTSACGRGSRRDSARAQAALEGAGAEVMQAVPTMLELVPTGVNKWVGMRALLADLARARLPPRLRALRARIHAFYVLEARRQRVPCWRPSSASPADGMAALR